jgi:WD40-like Beta Propeller Repeat
MRAFAFACVLAAACGPSHHGGDDDSTATLTINPPTSDLTVMNATPVTEDFTATLTYIDGTTKDVTTDTSFGVTTGYGDFTAQTLTARGAGKMDITGVYVDKQATAEVIVHANGVRVDPTLPSNTPDQFTNGTEVAARAPTIVYPALDVVMPRNLGNFEVHWTDANANDVFEVSLHTDLSDMRVYVPGGNGVATLGPEPSWALFLPAEWAAAIGTETTVTYQVRGMQTANPAAGIGAAAPRLVKLSNEDMNGGIYYWASSGDDANTPEGIWRHDMAKPSDPVEQFETLVQTNGRCIACHVISRDGTEMAVTYDGGDQNSNTIDVATKTFGVESTAWNFAAFTPDGKQLLTNHDGVLVVRDYMTQAIVATPSSAGNVTHPDLSPDGTKLVYVRPSVVSSDWAFGGGQIYTRTFDQGTDTFGTETLLVADASNNYYPSFSPDGKYVLFNKSTNNTTVGAYNNGSAAVWVIAADGSAPAIELKTLNTAANLTNSWARWAPFAQTVGSDNIYWITVSSKRDFGTRIDHNAFPAGSGDDLAGRPQIWMTAFVPSAADAQIDPSQPPFRLPFQNIQSNNHIAQWTQQIVVTQ